MSVNVSIPATVPVLARICPKSLIGLSIEMDRWADWAGGAVGTPNAFLNQALNNLANYTGHPVFLRVGANSQDHGFLAPNVQVVNLTFPEPTQLVPQPEAAHIAIGRDWYRLSGNLPEGTEFTWGVNLRELNVSETVGQVVQLYDAFYGSDKEMLSHVYLKRIEMGNEPDIYDFPNPLNPNRTLPGWGPIRYVESWTTAAREVIKAVDMDFKEAPGFQAGVIADPFGAWTYTIAQSLVDGILDPAVAKYIKTWSVHQYFGNRGFTPATSPQTGSLMGRSGVRGNTTKHALYSSQAERAGLQYVIGETNSFSLHGTPGVSDSAEAAIWLADYVLQAATLNVQQLDFHGGVGFAYNLIQAVEYVDEHTNDTRPPHIQGAYYGALMANEFIGYGSDVHVAELSTFNTRIAAYGAWESDHLRRVLILNSNVHDPGRNATRTFETINLHGFVTSGKKLALKRFFTPQTNSTVGLLWGGQSFETVDAVPTGQVEYEYIDRPIFNVSATEGVLVCF
ncbi:hypothetical protein QFC24_006103 [Naganishia onofrii]|uniref:Uncharacterized protein n=1 Tax=Naganishia onofrii TaxID=1851511 RepID=A0ACC2X6S5_9TREE|nr:hypothetical protein QFC24_006103 [Naganishia onofrii]